MSKLYVCKTSTMTLGAACLKVVNDDGVELSVAFDDSCGCLPNLARVSMATFNGPHMEDRVGEEVYHVTAEDLLEALAKHLGYSVTKK